MQHIIGRTRSGKNYFATRDIDLLPSDGIQLRKRSLEEKEEALKSVEEDTARIDACSNTVENLESRLRQVVPPKVSKPNIEPFPPKLQPDEKKEPKQNNRKRDKTAQELLDIFFARK